jgi:hypothetical protein
MLTADKKVDIITGILKTAFERDPYLAELVYAIRCAPPEPDGAKLHVELLDRTQLDIEIRYRG